MKHYIRGARAGPAGTQGGAGVHYALVRTRTDVMRLGIMRTYEAA